MIGVARSAMSDEQFRQQFQDSLREFAKVDGGSDEVTRSLQAQMYFVSGEMDDPGLYERLDARLREIGSRGRALLPGDPARRVYGPVVEALGEAGLAGTPETGWRRLIVEKPFGTDLASAQSLNALLHRHFTEEQIFRIDHYLGKETVQNLMVLRFANGMFEPIWNRRYIDHVQITAAETVGVERRAAYYEGAGALRDMVQNHLMQLLALVAMEPPTAFTAASVRDRKMDALLAVQPLVGQRHRRAGGRAGPVSRRVGERCGSARLSIGAGGRAGLDDRDLRRAAAAVWTAGAGPGCRSISAPASGCPKRTTEIAIQFHRPPLQIFKRVSPSPLALGPAGHQRAAGRGDLAAVRRQASRRPGCRSRR